MLWLCQLKEESMCSVVYVIFLFIYLTPSMSQTLSGALPASCFAAIQSRRNRLSEGKHGRNSLDSAQICPSKALLCSLAYFRPCGQSRARMLNPCYSTDVYRLAGKSTGARTYPEYLSSPSAQCLNTEIKESRAVTTRRLSAQRCFSVRTSCIGPCLLEVLHSSSVCSYI